MKNITQILAIAIVLLSCNSNKPVRSSYESETLKIEQVSPKVFKHTSYLDTEAYGKVACNGMMYFNENEAIIFDTPIDNQASAELITWIGESSIKAVVVTHFHIDCLGGLEEFHSKGIPSYANNLTIELAKKEQQIVPQKGFEKRLEITIGNEIAVAQYFGQGHTKDNIVGYIPSEKTMFGGCLLKELNAGKGNLADANTIEWPKTIQNIKRELPALEIIVPGHGKNGGIELLEYTIGLFTKN